MKKRKILSEKKRDLEVTVVFYALISAATVLSGVIEKIRQS